MLNIKRLQEYNIKELIHTKKHFNTSFGDEFHFHYVSMLNSVETDAYLNMNNLKRYRQLRTENRILSRAHFLVLYWFEKFLFVTFREQFNYEVKELTNFDNKITPEAELEILEELRKADATNFKIAETYYLIKESFLDLANEAKYEQAKNAVLKNFDLFSLSNKHNMLLFLETIIIFSNKKTFGKWKKHDYDIKMIMLEKEVFSNDENYMYYLTYDNIVKGMLDEGELNKTENFIKTYTSNFGNAQGKL
jgi:hypothetical protein